MSACLLLCLRLTCLSCHSAQFGRPPLFALLALPREGLLVKRRSRPQHLPAVPSAAAVAC